MIYIRKRIQLLLFTAVVLTLAVATAFFKLPQTNADTVRHAARSMVVMDAASRRVLKSHNAYEKIPMASTTKIVTAITAIEHCDPNKVVEIPRAACGIEGSSIYLEAGEKLTLRQLLFGLMLRSGNDCAVAIALSVGGSVEKFAAMMNDTARKLDAVDSNFVNPHGLDAKQHYTTAYDLALISAYAMKNPLFKEIAGTKRIKIPHGGRDYDRLLINKNKMLSNYPGATGIKTGYTKRAGRCLVSSAQRGGLELICVVLNCGPMWEESAAGMDSVFDKFKTMQIVMPYSYWGETEVINRSGIKVGLYSREPFSYPLSAEEEHLISTKIELPGHVSAPLKKDTEVGKIKVYYDNQLIFCGKIYTINEVGSATVIESLKKILQNMY